MSLRVPSTENTLPWLSFLRYFMKTVKQPYWGQWDDKIQEGSHVQGFCWCPWGELTSLVSTNWFELINPVVVSPWKDSEKLGWKRMRTWEFLWQSVLHSMGRISGKRQCLVLKSYALFIDPVQKMLFVLVVLCNSSLSSNTTFLDMLPVCSFQISLSYSLSA